MPESSPESSPAQGIRRIARLGVWSGKQKPARKRQNLLRVGQNLFRSNRSKIYYAIFKRNGHQLRKSLKTDDRKVAEKRLQELSPQIARLSAQSQNVTFPELANRWLATIRPALKTKTADSLASIVDKLSLYFVKPFHKISRRDIEGWLSERTKHLSARTYNHYKCVLARIFDFAIRDGLTSVWPETPVLGAR